MENDNRIVARLFTGILITSEIRMHLNQNSAWNNAQISAFHGSDDLFEVRHGKNRYIGCYIEGHKIPLSEVQKFFELTKSKLLVYCPHLSSSACKFYIFSQLFIH